MASDASGGLFAGRLGCAGARARYGVLGRSRAVLARLGGCVLLA